MDDAIGSKYKVRISASDSGWAVYKAISWLNMAIKSRTAHSLTVRTGTAMTTLWDSNFYPSTETPTASLSLYIQFMKQNTGNFSVTSSKSSQGEQETDWAQVRQEPKGYSESSLISELSFHLFAVPASFLPSTPHYSPRPRELVLMKLWHTGDVSGIR